MKSSSQVITKFPAEDLLVAGSKYHAVGADLLRCGTRSPTSTPQPAMVALSGIGAGISRRSSCLRIASEGLGRSHVHAM